MRNIFYIFIILLVGCTAQTNKEEVTETSVIESVCRDSAADSLTQEEIERWDEMNENGGYLLIRGAERNLDTIVNHLHLIFTTEL